jgi:ABC-type lipoprotein export system ATPase subunit
MGAAISISGLGKTYARQKSGAVSDLTVDIAPGEFLAVIGRSGSGKSTMLAMVGGIARPSNGKVLVDGTDVWAGSNTARADLRNGTIGFVFQFASLLPSLRAVDNVALPALVSGALNERIAYARARALLAQVGLESKCDSYPGELSGGEQRRVAIARALINSPKILLADEPTADLDDETEKEILDLLVEMRRLHHFTLIVVTHNNDIATRADRVLTMQAGVGTVSNVNEGVETPVTARADAVKNIFAITAENAAREKVVLGSGLDRFVGRVVLIVIPLLSLIYIGNMLLASYQQSLINARLDAVQVLEELAMSSLKAGVKNIVMTEDGGYELSIFLRNTKENEPMYVLAPTVRVFVQMGTSWQEVALKELGEKRAPVSAVKGEQILRYSLKPEVANYSQLIPYYMHVRITNDMMVSPSSQPRHDLIERNDSYYVYLRPHMLSDETINSRLKFAEKPPVYIPMPPH